MNFCEDDILGLIILSVKIFDMINLKKPGILQEINKLYDGVSQYGDDSDTKNESVEYINYYELSEHSDLGENIGFRNL